MSTAAFLDFENVYLGIPRVLDQKEWIRSVVEKLLKELGDLPNILKAYGNWENYDQASSVVSRLGFQPIYTLSQHGKNSADLEMSLDIHKLLLTNDDIQQFVIISGDRDFIPIARRVAEAGKDLTVVSFSRCSSADLEVIAKKGRFINLDTFLPEKVLNAVRDERYEKQLLVMKQVVAAHRRYNSKGVWLAPFFRDWLNPVMPNAKNDERKEIIGQLEDLGAIQVVQRAENVTGGYSDRTYAVLEPKIDHSMYILAASLIDQGSSTSSF